MMREGYGICNRGAKQGEPNRRGKPGGSLEEALAAIAAQVAEDAQESQNRQDADQTELHFASPPSRLLMRQAACQIRQN